MTARLLARLMPARPLIGGSVRRSIALAALVLAIPAAGYAADTAAAPRLQDLAFMNGAWQADFAGDVVEEHFSAPRAGTIVGVFRWMSGDATDLTEHITIEPDDGKILMRIRHFNEGNVPWKTEADGPATFTLASVRDGRAVFEDPDNDFPTRIVYHRTAPTTLHVALEGKTDDDPHMEFEYRSMHMTSTATDALTEVGQSMGYDGGLTVAVQVKDMKKSIDFYQNVVGFKLQYAIDEIAWCELSTSVPSVNLGLSEVEEPKIEGPTPTFGVKDLDHARQQLEDKGVRFDGPTREIPGMVRLATFYDLDGNALMLFQSLGG